jgi:hypothetical protein
VKAAFRNTNEKHHMESLSNPFQACKNIVLKPNGVFAKIKTTDNWSWVPFFLVAGATFLTIYSYLNVVDINWFIDSMLQLIAKDVSPAEVKAMRDGMEQGNVLLFSLSLGLMFKIVLFNAFMAAYLNQCAKMDEVCVQGFTDWFGFCWWISLPLVAVQLLTCVVIWFSQSPQLSQTVLELTSLAFIFSVDIRSPWFGLFESLKLEYIWIIYLTTVGLSQWTSLAKKQIYRIAIGPYVLIWGLWLLLLLF